MATVRGIRPSCLWIGSIASLCLALASSCSEEVTGGSRGAVVILLDTVRADHVSCYGYERPTTPAIDRLAGQGVRFRTVVAPSPWTFPSVTAFLGADDPGRLLDSGARMTRSMVEAFSDAGLATAAFTEGGYVSRFFGMDRGFRSFREEEGPVRLVTGGKLLHEAAAANVEATFDGAIGWLEKHADRPFFLFIHTYEPHTPYTRHEFDDGMEQGRIGPAFEIPELKRVQEGSLELTQTEKRYIETLYDGGIRAADRQVGRLLQALERLGLSDRAVVVVTSDHGEEMGQHFARHVFDHGHSLRDDLLLVPLVIHDPTRSFGGRTIEAQSRLIDVLPTVADLLGVPVDPPTAGRSLLPLVTGAERNDRLAFSANNNVGPARVSLRDGRHKLILTVGPPVSPDEPFLYRLPNVQLYDLVIDPLERTNIAPRRAELRQTLLRTLKRWAVARGTEAGMSDRAIEDEALLDRLRSLGYLD
jgi:arylsulfatase A-like enzyme